MKTERKDLLDQLFEHTQAAIVIVMAARLDRPLEWILEGHMRSGLTQKFKKSIFRGYAPLSTFSAKIDICYAFGLISDDDRQTLHHIREVRNKFAHADDHTTFDSSVIAELATRGNPVAVSERAYIDAAAACSLKLQAVLDKQLKDKIRAGLPADEVEKAVQHLEQELTTIMTPQK